MKLLKLSLLPLCLLLSNSGCAFHKATTTATTNGTNTVAQTSSYAWTFFDANDKLSQFRNTMANGTNAQGTTVGDVSQGSSGSNTVAALDRLITLFQMMPK